jgi:hypothetical protein
MNGIEPLAWLTDVLERMVLGRIKVTELGRMLALGRQPGQLAAAATVTPDAMAARRLQLSRKGS